MFNTENESIVNCTGSTALIFNHEPIL